jgi:hypothetical protein
MAKKSAADAALAWAAKAHKLHDALIVDDVQVHDPDSGEKLHSFRLVSAAQGNGPSHQVFIDTGGSVVEGTAKHEALLSAARAAPPSVAPAMAPAPLITIAPDTNILVLNSTDTLDETLIVTVPKNAGPAKADVYFLADTTASMGSILQAVKNGANNVLATLGGLGADLVFGVGNYKDFRSGDPFCFQHQVSPTNAVATVTAAINTWAATGGGDLPEGAFFALDKLATPPGARPHLPGCLGAGGGHHRSQRDGQVGGRGHRRAGHLHRHAGAGR